MSLYWKCMIGGQILLSIGMGLWVYQGQHQSPVEFLIGLFVVGGLSAVLDACMIVSNS